MIGSTKLRSWLTTPARTAAWCNRRSGVIARAGELADAGPDQLGLALLQRGDPGRARRGVKRDPREIEGGLQRAALGVDVLNPPDRYQRSADRPQTGAQVDLVVAHLVAP